MSKQTVYFAQFYQYSAIDKSEIIEACGDRAVIILDGRAAQHENARIAARVARERGYVGYTLHRGRLNGHSTKTQLQMVYRYDVCTLAGDVLSHANTAQGAGDAFIQCATDWERHGGMRPVYTYDHKQGSAFPYCVYHREPNAWVGTNYASIGEAREAVSKIVCEWFKG